MLTDIELHAKRGLNQIRTERELQRRQREEEDRMGLVRESPEERIRSDPGLQRRSRFSVATSILSQSLITGGFAGFVLGSLYAFRTKHPSPVVMGLSTAASMGLLAGQYAGFRFLMPDAIKRHYHNFTADPSNANDEMTDFDKELHDMLQPEWLSTLWIGTDGEPPSFLQDWTARDSDTVESALAGGLAGYFTTRFQAVKFADSQRLKSISTHSAGVRGAVFWSLFFGIGQICLHQFDDFRRNQIAKRHIQELYINDNRDALTDILPEGVRQVPERKDIVPLPLSYYMRNPVAFFQEYDIDWSWVLPFVHEKEDYEYRVYLESKQRLLEDEVNELKQLKLQLEQERLEQ